MNARQRACRSVAGAAAALLLLPTTASATTPLLTDPSGDANVGDRLCDTEPLASTVSGCPISVPALSEGSVDIVEGDIAQSGSDLVFTLKMSDLDAPQLNADDTPRYFIGVHYGNVEVQLDVTRVQQASTTTGSLRMASSPWSIYVFNSIAVTFDDVSNMVEWTLPLSTANDGLAFVCAGCTPIGAGATFDSPRATAVLNLKVGVVTTGGASPGGDEARSANTFTLA